MHPTIVTESRQTKTGNNIGFGRREGGERESANVLHKDFVMFLTEVELILLYFNMSIGKIMLDMMDVRSEKVSAGRRVDARTECRWGRWRDLGVGVVCVVRCSLFSLFGNSHLGFANSFSRFIIVFN